MHPLVPTLALPINFQAKVIEGIVGGCVSPVADDALVRFVKHELYSEDMRRWFAGSHHRSSVWERN